MLGCRLPEGNPGLSGPRSRMQRMYEYLTERERESRSTSIARPRLLTRDWFKSRLISYSPKYELTTTDKQVLATTPMAQLMVRLKAS